MEDKCINIRKRKLIKVVDITNEPKEDKLFSIANDLLNNRIFISSQFKVINTDIDELWNSDLLNNRTWRYWIHALAIVEYLLRAYEIFGKNCYMEKAMEIFFSWKNHNYPESRSDMVWHDHAAALRLVIICRLFENWRINFWDESVAEEFFTVVQIHARMLIDSGFYRAKHNHGLDQDIALYTAGTVFDFLAEAAFWRDIALERLKIQLRELFLPDGSYLEQTPSYSFIMCNRLGRFKQFLKQQNDETYFLLEDIIARQLQCLINLVQPDGFIPPIGDGNPCRLNLKIFNHLPPKALETARYVISKGQKGRMPEELDRVFPEGGYATLRNQWENDLDTVQMVFYSAYNVRTHKHHDDLSVIIYAHGQPLLADAGKYNYVYSSAERKFVVSSRAHNSVVVDGKNTSIHPDNLGKSGLTAYYFDQGFSFVSGAHALYDDIFHQRMIVYFKPYDFVIIDYLSGDKEHTFEQIFNFHPSVDCSIKGQQIIARTKNGLQLMLSPLPGRKDPKVTLVEGQTDPMRGWCCLEYGKLLSSWSAGYKLEGNSAQFATHINLNPPKRIMKKFVWKKKEIMLDMRGKRINISLGEDKNVLKINGAEADTTVVNTLTAIKNGKKDN